MNTPEDYNNNSIETGQIGSMEHKNKPGFSNTDISEINSLDKVRDILFGNQMREVEKKISRLEERLLQECTNLRDETRKRFDSLENYIKKEVESLTERQKYDKGENDALVKAIVEEHRNTTISLEKRVTQFDEQTTNSQRELREQILNQSKSLQDDIRQKYQEIQALIERETSELNHQKTSRSALAAMLTDLAIRLNSETKS